MTPAARLQAAVEVVALIEAALADDAGETADRCLARYLAQRRYIGSKDRRALSDRVYGILRARGRLLWWLSQADLADARSFTESARRLVLADLVLRDQVDAVALQWLFDGGRYHPPSLTEADHRLIARLQGQRLTCAVQPDWVRGEVPRWLWPDCKAAFGTRAACELQALHAEAPLDLRVNGLKATRAQAQADLTAAGLQPETTSWSPQGLRLTGRPRLQDTQAWRAAWVEPQDEGSQIAALLCAVQPGMAVADLCAGAGGKTLALAAELKGQGRLLAVDIDGRRLERLKRRASAAGAELVETRRADATQALTDLADSFDRVLVDAPCSGSGTWRRSPDARWRLPLARLTGYCDRQKALLARAAALVRPGGRLIYVTCSFLPCENELQAHAFLTDHKEFEVLPLESVWADSLDGDLPAEGPYLQLTPARHGTDGFFVAIFQRRAEPRS